jgi:hypothetical protein
MSQLEGGEQQKMPREPGQVGGSPDAQIKQSGERIDALYNFQKGGVHDHLVSNDGLNAAYLRENGQVIVNDQAPNPYGS